MSPVRGKNVSALESWGRVQCLLDEQGSPFVGLEQRLADALDLVDFDPASDAIALTGSMAHIACLIGLIMAESESCRVLIFDSRHSAYVEKTWNVPASLT